ncbi:hypothetical protein [Vibrio neptunius]|uniref:hypothetical protein n=1 Tax=Vibrio neptunius TaxID=170651 RepID=UPI0019CF554E|nr:hypothetical protein [Vibrio neptunius]MBN3574556.1 hypothetical protein [Vibrio neptunius]
MKFARYWAKKEFENETGIFWQKKLSVWGSSNESQEQAAINAENRRHLMTDFFSGHHERGDDYEYWTGVIKEEILLERQNKDGEPLAIISRNGYGAAVLNTSNVVFGDIDVFAPSFVDRFLQLFGREKKDKSYYLALIEAYQKRYPDLAFRVYETHSGLRFILTNKLYAPRDKFVDTLFSDLNVDPLYVHLCKKQECFRARLTPKPWRIGMPRPASRFPRSEQSSINEFQQWLGKYNAASVKATSAKYITSFGEHRPHQDVQTVIEIHDQHIARTDVELA